MINFYKKCYLRALPCFAITIVLGLLINHFVPLLGWKGIIVKGCAVVFVFAVVFFLLYFTKKEKKEAFSKIKGFLKRKKQ